MSCKNEKSGDKGGDGRHKFVQTLVSPDEHKALTILTLDMNCTLAWLLRDIIKNFLKEKESSHDRSREHGRSSSTKEAKEAV